MPNPEIPLMNEKSRTLSAEVIYPSVFHAEYLLFFVPRRIKREKLCLFKIGNL